MSDATNLTADHGKPALPLKRHVPAPILYLSWAVNALALLGAGAWLFWSPTAVHELDLYLGNPPFPIPEQRRPVVVTVLLFFTPFLSLGGILGGLFFGPPRFRSVRAWLALTLMIAAWLAFLVTRHDLAWAGECWRTRRQIPVYQPAADSLRTSWPNADGVLEPIGAFNAYPHGHPRMLLLITPWRPTDNLQTPAIERSNAGGLRFELVGRGSSAWLEWHPAGQQPASFTGGLETTYSLTRSSPLGNGWYLTTYRAM